MSRTIPLDIKESLVPYYRYVTSNKRVIERIIRILVDKGNCNIIGFVNEGLYEDEYPIAVLFGNRIKWLDWYDNTMHDEFPDDLPDDFLVIPLTIIMRSYKDPDYRKADDLNEILASEGSSYRIEANYHGKWIFSPVKICGIIPGEGDIEANREVISAIVEYIYGHWYDYKRDVMANFFSDRNIPFSKDSPIAPSPEFTDEFVRDFITEMYKDVNYYVHGPDEISKWLDQTGKVLIADTTRQEVDIFNRC